MVSSWYLTHATKNVVWIFTLSFFVLQRKTQGSCMSKHENKRYAVCRTKSMLNAYAWWCNDSCKIWCWNMITDKCRNDMFIMTPWRDTYAMHDMNALTNTRARKIISSYLRIRGRSAPCVHNMTISSNNHTAKAYMTFRLYAWQWLKGTQRIHFVPLF